MVRRGLLAGALALGLLAFRPFPAHADFVPVPSTDWTGSRSTADGGVTATDGWNQGNGGFMITWEITQSGTLYNYTYTISDADGQGLHPDFSLWIVEVSPTITADNVTELIPRSDPLFEGPDHQQVWVLVEGAYLSLDLYGIWLSADWSFSTTREPVWGDFYALSGNYLTAAAWNSGITGPEPDSMMTDFTPWIPIPDGGGGQIPEPSSLLLLTLGGCGVLASRLRRKP